MTMKARTYLVYLSQNPPFWVPSSRKNDGNYIDLYGSKYKTGFNKSMILAYVFIKDNPSILYRLNTFFSSEALFIEPNYLQKR